MHVSRALDLLYPRLVRRKISKQVVHRATHVSERRGKGPPCFLAVLNLDDGLATDSFDFPAQNSIILIIFYLLKIGSDDLELQAGTSRVQYQDVHCILYTASISHPRRRRRARGFSAKKRAPLA